MNAMKKKTQVDNNGCKYILFRIDICCSGYFLAVDEKGHTDRDITFWRKKTKSIRKRLGCKLTKINTSNAKNGCDLDYEVGNVQTFTDEFKNKKIKKLEKQLIKEKEIREKLEKKIIKEKEIKVESRK